jgi:ABC-type transport system substrate-binding protein
VRLGITRPATLDPALATTPDELLVDSQLYRSLTAYDPITLAPVPAVASAWTSSADFEHWDFTVAAGSRFSNGQQISAADVVASLRRVEANRAVSPGTELLRHVRDITSPGSGVVHLDLDAPLAVLPSVLGSTNLAILPAGTGAIPAQPVGSGPFLISSSTTSRLVLQPVPGVKAFVDRVEFDFFADAAASYQAFVAGQVDWSRVPSDQLASAKERYGTAGIAPYLAELFYGLNVKSTTFADIRFRQAIVEAVDRAAIDQDVYHGSVLPLDSIVAAGIPGYPVPVCGTACRYDPAAARALLSAAFPGKAPPAVTIDYDEDPTQEAVAKAIATDLAAVGIATTLVPKPLAAYQALAASGQLQLFHLGWVAGYPSPEAFLGPLFGTASPDNLTGLSSNVAAPALAAAEQEPNASQRFLDYAASERATLGQFPLIPLGQYQTVAVISSRTRGFVTLVTGAVDLTKVWLAS